MIKQHVSRLLTIAALACAPHAFAQGAYECGIAQGDAPTLKPLVDGMVQFTAGEYFGYAQEDAANNMLIAGIFHKADANVPEQALAMGLTQLGSENLYLVAYHDGKEIQVICRKK